MTYDYFECLGEVKDGKFLGLKGKKHFDEAMTHFPDGFIGVKFSVLRERRSHQQNRYWHGVVIPACSEYFGYELDEMKDILSLKLIPKEITDRETGEVYKVPGHTSTLTTKEFADMIERAQRWAAPLGLNIPSPNEVPDI